MPRHQRDIAKENLKYNEKWLSKEASGPSAAQKKWIKEFKRRKWIEKEVDFAEKDKEIQDQHKEIC